ncbi:MAG: SHOCT domain-containing protein [Calditrichaceae bacterium]
MWYDMCWLGMGFSGLFWIIILALIVWVVIRLTGNNQSKQQPTSSGETPMEILKKRYAKGEITKDQFEQIKKDIS